MKYFIIHIKHGRRDGCGYSVLTAIENGNEEDAVKQIVAKNYLDWFEDAADTGYTREISLSEYESLVKDSQMFGPDGYMLGEKVFTAEDLAMAKKICFENWEKENIDIGFEYQDLWISNPFLDSTGRFELESLHDVYEHYGHEDGVWEYEGRENVYNFILRILGLECFMDEDATKKFSDNSKEEKISSEEWDKVLKEMHF